MNIICFILSILFSINSLKLTSSEIKQIQNTGLLRVTGTSDYYSHENQQKCCFSIEIENKNKRKGYEKIKKKFKAVKTYLINNNIISDAASFQLLKQQIRMNHNKKLWYFKRIVCFIFDEQNQKQIYKLLKKRNARKILFRSFATIDEEDLFLKAFHDAKQKARKMLEKADYRIKKIKSIRSLNKDLQLPYSQMYDSSDIYDPQVSTISEQVKRSTSVQRMDDQRQQKEIQHIEIQIIFIVENAKSNHNNDDESSSDQQGQSQVHRQKDSDNSRMTQQDSSQQL